MKIIKTFNDDNHAVVDLSGHFTLENVSFFTEKVTQLLNEKKQYFFFNFKDITMLDSSGIGALLKCANSMKNLGITLTLYNVNSHIETIMRSAYLHKIFSINTEKDIKKKFQTVKL